MFFDGRISCWAWGAKQACETMAKAKAAARSPCLLCGRPLHVVGTARKNGVRHHGDWAGRKYHKACFAQLHPARDRSTSSGRRGGRRSKGRRVVVFV